MKNASIWQTLPLPDGSRVDVVLTRRARQSIGLRIHDGVLELVAHPRVPEAQLHDVLRRKLGWISGHVQRQRAQQGAAESALDGLIWRGQRLPLRLTGGARKSARIEDGGVAVGGVAAGEDAALHAALCALLKREAQLLFPSRLHDMAQACERQPAGWQLSGARTRWGSCTAAGVIRLNWRLMQAPPQVLDYVIAHELSHLKHMNHSPAFWSETARLFPAWRETRQWLKQHGNTLFLLG